MATIAGTFIQVIAGFFSAHRGKKNAQSDSQSKAKQKTLHQMPPEKTAQDFALARKKWNNYVGNHRLALGPPLFANPPPPSYPPPPPSPSLLSPPSPSDP